jgi:hypothetical protein
MWRLYKTGIWLTTGFIRSHTVTHNYSVQLTTVHHNTCRVSSLCLHWLPVFQHRRTFSPLELTWPTRLALQDWLTLGPNTNSSVFWRLALCNSLDRTTRGLTASARLYTMAGPLLSHVMFTARVRHFVYVIVTRRVMFTVRLLRARPPYCLRHTLLLPGCLQQARHNIYSKSICWV